MNVESLKTELQQVLDNDVLLRKEFNSLKRSLSDYRNQLIMRDEDCKRLQVTIDVLNTKLVVMERDNSTYKAELSSFKELRGTIKEQLEDKQTEIDARLAEIQALRDDLNTMAANYEASMSELRTNGELELERVKADYEQQISGLKSNAHYIESGIREEYENRLTELSNNWAEKEQNLLLQHQESLRGLLSQHEDSLSNLKSSYEQQISGIAAGSSESQESLLATHRLELTNLETLHAEKLESMSSVYQDEIQHLKSSLEEQRSTLTTNFNSQVENLKLENENREALLQSQFDTQLADLQAVKTLELNETVGGYESRIATLIQEYEDKLSNTLIHSNAQNSKLNEELGKSREEQDRFTLELSDLTNQLQAHVSRVSELEQDVLDRDLRLSAQQLELSETSSAFETFRNQASQSESERMEELNAQLVQLNQSHSEFVAQLQESVDNLNVELSNMTLLLETTTNQLGETEVSLELRVQELTQAQSQIDELNARIESFSVSFEDKETEVENYKRELESSVKEELTARNIEFDKLLTENGQLISEIDLAQDKVEAQDYEISLLKAELEEIRTQSVGKSDYFKETLANRNFEITNLEANNAALAKEVQMLKDEVLGLSQNLQESASGSEELQNLRSRLDERNLELEQLRVQNASLEAKIHELSAENEQFSAEIGYFHDMVAGLNEHVAELNLVISKNEADLQSASASVNTEHEAFVDRLFKQIDELNDQRLALLDEKEQMANQLLKMNEVVGSISQQVESERIDVTGLNNHRKNVILANNSGAPAGQSPMKEQINDLVREIDKCIALLSA
jgi:chromosome segregation ATPase